MSRSVSRGPRFSPPGRGVARTRSSSASRRSSLARRARNEGRCCCTEMDMWASRRSGGRDAVFAPSYVSVPARRATVIARRLERSGRSRLASTNKLLQFCGTLSAESGRKICADRALAASCRRFTREAAPSMAFRHHAEIRILMDGDSGISVVGPFNALWASAPLAASTSIARQPRCAAGRGEDRPREGGGRTDSPSGGRARLSPSADVARGSERDSCASAGSRREFVS